MDLTSFLKSRNVFGPNAQPVDTSQYNQVLNDSTPQTVNNTISPSDKFKQMYSDVAEASPGPAQQKYRDFLDAGPPEKTPPSVPSRIGAILAGVGSGLLRQKPGAEVAQDVLDRPYNQAMGAYKTQADILGKGAADEERDREGKVGLYNDVLRDEQADKRANQAATNEADKVKIAQDKQANAEKRTEIYRKLNADKNNVVQIDNNGNVNMLNKSTNEVTPVTLADGTPMKSEHIPESEKIELQTQGRLQVVAAQGSNAQKNIASRGEQARETKGTPSADSGDVETTSTSTVTDAKGKPVGAKTTTTTKKKKPVNNDPLGIR